MEKLKRNSYVMYYNVSEAALDLPDTDYKEFGKLIHDYVFFGVEPETDNLAIKMLLKVYLPALNNSLAVYDKRATGNNGGRKRKPQETTKNHTVSDGLQEEPQETTSGDMVGSGNPNYNNNDNYNDNENKNVNEIDINQIDITPVEVPVTSNNNPVEQKIEIKEEKESIEQNKLSDKEFNSWCLKCVDKFKGSIGLGKSPTVQEILGYMIENEVMFEKSDFEQYPISDNERRLVPTEDMNNYLYQLIQPMALNYGYAIDNNEVLDKFNKWFIKSRLAGSFSKIELI